MLFTEFQAIGIFIRDRIWINNMEIKCIAFNLIIFIEEAVSKGKIH
jgi:hypothetical protein